MYEESPKAAAAFARYCVQPDRSLRKLADETGTKLAQLGKWSRLFDWQERVKQYDTELIERQAAAKRKARDKAIEDMNQRHILFAVNLQHDLVKRISSLMDAGEFDARAAVSALKLATDLERLARGEPTQSTKLEHNLGPDLAGARDQLFNKLAAFAKQDEQANSV